MGNGHLPVGFGIPNGGLQSSINSSPSFTPPLSGNGRWNFESMTKEKKFKKLDKNLAPLKFGVNN